MSFQAPLTIAQAIDAIRDRRYVLPGIQREFVWSARQIEALFDSVMRGYPIGSFLYWSVGRERVQQYQFYDFIRDFHERDRRHNERVSVLGLEGVTAILDGQQRLTALYLGTHGSFAYRTKYKAVYPERRLYLDLLEDDDDWDGGYRFRFLTEPEAADTVRWFPVGDVLNFQSIPDINRYLRSRDLGEVEHASEALFRLYEMMRVRSTINYYLEGNQDLDQVLHVFIRVNSGGTPLSYSDLLLSVASAQWSGVDAREEINGLVTRLNGVGEGFRFDRDFVLKAGLVLAEIPSIGFKVTNFGRENIERIEAAWPGISTSLMVAAEIAAGFGLNGSSLTSNNALIPVAYYLQKRGLPTAFATSAAFAKDRQVIRTWLLSTLLKGTFGGQGDTVLAMMRSVIAESTGSFPAAEINRRLTGMYKAVRFAPEEIDALLDGRYGLRQTAQVLALLYPGIDYRKRYHLDHLHPRSGFDVRRLVKAGIDEEEARWMVTHRDDIANLGMLEDWENLEKTDRPLADWLGAQSVETRAAAMARHRIPEEASLDIRDFREFLGARRELLKGQLMQLLHWHAEDAPEGAEPVASSGAEPPSDPEAFLAEADARDELRERVKPYLEQVAARRKTTTLAALADHVRLDLEDSAARDALSEALKAVSLAEADEQRPLLSAVVVQSDTGLPTSGLWTLAQMTGRVRGGEDSTTFADRELEAVWAHWATPDAIVDVAAQA